MTKKKIRFNAVDVVIILVILGLIAGALYLFVWRNRGTGASSAQETCRIEYVVEIKKVEEQYANAVTVGQPVEDAVWRNAVGTVVGVEVTDYAETLFDDETKTEKTAYLDGYVNLKITVEADAAETDAHFTVNGTVVCVGKLYSLRFPSFYGNGYCIMLTRGQ